MREYEIRNFSFKYMNSERLILDDISLEIDRGDFVVICGPSGCGKTTFLRHLKTALRPNGNYKGSILFANESLENIDLKRQAAEIGFVLQNVDAQIVTDKVWHELAFGLESLGVCSKVIRRRVAEVATFFGIQHLYDKKTTELSGGQKQLLNLASIMTMNPNVLILDEPTSQLDTIAAGNFLAMLGRINKEFGTTIIMTEHRLEEVLPMSTKAVMMENGKVVYTGSAYELGSWLKDRNSNMFLTMPAPMRVYCEVPVGEVCPITVAQGAKWLRENFGESRKGKNLSDSSSLGRENEGKTVDIRYLDSVKNEGKTVDIRYLDSVKNEGKIVDNRHLNSIDELKDIDSGLRTTSKSEFEKIGISEGNVGNEKKDTAVELKEVYYRYPGTDKDILKKLSMKVYFGEIYAILGGNGTGKTTALSVIAGLKKANFGNVLIEGKKISKIKDLYRGLLGVVAQNPETMFAHDTVRAELEEMKKCNIVVRNNLKVKKKCNVSDEQLLELMKSSVLEDELTEQITELKKYNFAENEVMQKIDNFTNYLEEIIEICELRHLLKMHPYDLSGGEKQKLALAKILLLEPKIILLDEPTKGMDAEFKRKFARILAELKKKNICIIMVSHDIEFCAEFADRCGMFFDGEVVSEDTTRQFFAENNYYTTAANRMARGIIQDAILVEDIVKVLQHRKEFYGRT